MYYEHFGLTQAPFKITPNTDFFFSGGNRGPVLEALIYAITHGEGIVKVSGEVGSGKTMLCNMLQNRLPPNVESVYLANPSVAPEDVLHAIAFELGLGVDRHADRLEVMHALQDYLVQQHAAGQRVVVFIEESQSMPVATLEEIRLLSNLETRNDKLLQMVLFGQPELDEILRRPDIRQLRDRIAHSFRLEPLTDEQVREYLSFRMRAAGYRGPDIFSPAVVRQIARASSGLTRRINLIADKALLAAFAENTHTIEARHVNAALRDSEFGQPQLHARPALRYAWIGLGLIAGTVLGAGLYALVDSRTGAPSPAAIPPSQAAPDATAPASADPPAAPAAVPAPTPRAATAEATTSGAAVETPAAPAPGAALPAAQASSGPPFPPEQTLKPSGDLIADRIHATQNWLNSGASRPFSIQLLVTSNEEQLRNHLKALTKFVEVNDVYMYRSVAHGKPAVSVLWGTYDTLKAAEANMEELPRHLRANRPYIRSIEGIRAEVNRNTVTR